MELSTAERQICDGIAAAFPLEAANEVPPLRPFIVQIKRGKEIRLSFEVMGASSFAVHDQHDGLCAVGETISVKPRSLMTSADEISHIKAGWLFVGSARGGDHCAACGFCRGYEGAPGERLVECTLGQRASDKPEMCPAMAAAIEDVTA